MTTLPDKISSGTEDAIAVPVPGEAEVVEVREGMFGVQGTGDTSGYGGLVRRVTMPPAVSRPYGGWFDSVADDLGAALRGRLRRLDRACRRAPRRDHIPRRA